MSEDRPARPSDIARAALEAARAAPPPVRGPTRRRIARRAGTGAGPARGRRPAAAGPAGRLAGRRAGLVRAHPDRRGLRPLVDPRRPRHRAHCRPETLTEGELLMIAESTAWATQLRLLAPTILGKLRAGVGGDVVTRLRVVGPTAPSWKKGPRSVRGRGPRTRTDSGRTDDGEAEPMSTPRPDRDGFDDDGRAARLAGAGPPLGGRAGRTSPTSPTAASSRATATTPPRAPAGSRPAGTCRRPPPTAGRGSTRPGSAVPHHRRTRSHPRSRRPPERRGLFGGRRQRDPEMDAGVHLRGRPGRGAELGAAAGLDRLGRQRSRGRRPRRAHRRCPRAAGQGGPRGGGAARPGRPAGPRRVRRRLPVGQAVGRQVRRDRRAAARCGAGPAALPGAAVEAPHRRAGAGAQRQRGFDSRWQLLAAEDGPQVRRLVQDPAVQGLLLGTDDGDEFWTGVGHPGRRPPRRPPAAAHRAPRPAADGARRRARRRVLTGPVR